MDQYLAQCATVTEEFEAFCEPRLSCDVIEKGLVGILTDYSLSREHAVGQGYDVVSVMSSENQCAAAAAVKERYKFIDYYPCSVHALKLCFVHSSSYD